MRTNAVLVHFSFCRFSKKILPKTLLFLVGKIIDVFCFFPWYLFIFAGSKKTHERKKVSRVKKKNMKTVICSSAISFFPAPPPPNFPSPPPRTSGLKTSDCFSKNQKREGEKRKKKSKVKFRRCGKAKRLRRIEKDSKDAAQSALFLFAAD